MLAFCLNVGETAILDMLIGGSGFTAVVAMVLQVIRRDRRPVWTDRFGQIGWRGPPLDQLPRAPHASPAFCASISSVAAGLVVGRIIQLALSANS